MKAAKKLDYRGLLRLLIKRWKARKPDSQFTTLTVPIPELGYTNGFLCNVADCMKEDALIDSRVAERFKTAIRRELDGQNRAVFMSHIDRLTFLQKELKRVTKNG